MLKGFFLFLLFLNLGAFHLTEKDFTEIKPEKMKWFAEAKLGIFIHWGIYSVKGIDESWSFFNGYISYQDYMKQLSGFTARNYNPDLWAELILASGAKYAVLTSKHHDGLSLWNTKMCDLNTVKATPARRDLVAPFVAAIKKVGIKTGLYFSLSDWSHKDYPEMLRNKKRYDSDPVRWQRYLKFMNGQIKELVTRFEPDLLWFDGDWEHEAEEWGAEKIRRQILQWAPDLIINSRLKGYGDYETPENSIPITPPKATYWELCLTMNDSWGYQGNDKNYKTSNQIIRIFSDCIGMGGNLLLNISPKEDGSFPEEQIAILKTIGSWIKKHSEAIYGTTMGLPPGLHYGPSTISRNRKTLYLFLPYRPISFLAVKGLKSTPSIIRIVGDGTKLQFKEMMKPWWSQQPGILYIDVPPESLDPQMTVLALEFKEPLSISGK